jgi:hypothetical protein
MLVCGNLATNLDILILISSIVLVGPMIHVEFLRLSFNHTHTREIANLHTIVVDITHVSLVILPPKV